MFSKMQHKGTARLEGQTLENLYLLLYKFILWQYFSSIFQFLSSRISKLSPCVLGKLQKRIFLHCKREDENCKRGDKIAKEEIKKFQRLAPASVVISMHI